METRKKEKPRSKVKGCSTCTKRRILCDRGEPHCQKCVKRGLECPGYQPRLRWAGGVAVRGRLRGQRIPVIQDSVPQVPLEDAVSALPQGILGTLPVDMLIDYYDKNIAGLMVWVDSDKNLYRRVVLPLARHNPVVRLAIAAVSAQHSAMTQGNEDVPEAARNQAVVMIREKISSMTSAFAEGQDVGNKIDVCDAEWMLASILVLSCYEMVHSGADAAEYHRKAARSLVNILSTMESPHGELLLFLRNQLALYDVFGSTTTLDEASLEDVILPTDDDAVLFSKYLRIIHDITLQSRVGKDETSRNWRAELESARGLTLLAAGNLGIHNQQRHDFILLVDIHHNSALLYAARCLNYDSGGRAEIALSNLFRQLMQMEEPDQWLHNLPWPVMIAGIESHGNAEQQTIVSGLYRSISLKTGFKHFQHVLDFLEEFWAGDETDWRTLAGQWEASGRRILAV